MVSFHWTKLLLATGLAAGLAMPKDAAADIILSFWTSEASSGDAAVAKPLPGFLSSGFLHLARDLSHGPYEISLGNARQHSDNAADLLHFQFTTWHADQALAAGMGGFDPEPRLDGAFQDLHLSFAAGSALPTGHLRYGDGLSDAFLLFAADGGVSGWFNTDAGGPCGLSGHCAFGGSLLPIVTQSAPIAFAVAMTSDPVPVPEPGTLGLLGLGLVGLVAVRSAVQALSLRAAIR